MLSKERAMKLTIALAELSLRLPGLDSICGRLNRAFDIIKCDGSGYNITEFTPNHYQVTKASTSLFDNNTVIYDITKADGSKQWVCTCPDYDKAPMNLCKHRLAVMLVVMMQNGE